MDVYQNKKNSEKINKIKMKSNRAIRKIMAIKILRKPGVLAIALLVSNFFFVINADGQDAVGDYRSNATNFNWATVGSWQICSAAGNPGNFCHLHQPTRAKMPERQQLRSEAVKQQH